MHTPPYLRGDASLTLPFLLLLPFLVLFACSDKDGIITNWEFYLALDPNYMEGNDYVFDHFEWPHCDETSIIMK